MLFATVLVRCLLLFTNCKFFSHGTMCSSRSGSSSTQWAMQARLLQSTLGRVHLTSASSVAATALSSSRASGARRSNCHPLTQGFKCGPRISDFSFACRRWCTAAACGKGEPCFSHPSSCFNRPFCVMCDVPMALPDASPQILRHSASTRMGSLRR